MATAFTKFHPQSQPDGCKFTITYPYIHTISLALFAFLTKSVTKLLITSAGLGTRPPLKTLIPYLQQTMTIYLGNSSWSRSRGYSAWKKTQVSKKDMVAQLILTLCHSVYQLMQEPLPWRDVVALVAQLQQLFLDIIACHDFCEVVIPRITLPGLVPHPTRATWMGCFTRDNRICNELFCAGVEQQT